MQKAVKLEVKQLYKIFGPHPKKAMKLLEEGLEKDAIFEKTETTVITIEGEDVPYDAVVETITRLGGSVHSIDEVEVQASGNARAVGT